VFDRRFVFLECWDYVCVDEIIANEPFPPFRASIKDGYAVRLYTDRTREQIYEVIGRSDAGNDDVKRHPMNIFHVCVVSRHRSHRLV
jgi:molybdopterin biosynthesis enzyme